MANIMTSNSLRMGSANSTAPAVPGGKSKTEIMGANAKGTGRILPTAIALKGRKHAVSVSKYAKY